MNLFEYVPLDERQQEILKVAKGKADELFQIIDSRPKSREQALAITNLEQAVMWFAKSVSRETR